MKAPKLPSFIRQNQHNDYTPRYRYYDPAKERREQRERIYGSYKKDTESQNSEDTTDENRIRSNFRSRVEKNRHVKRTASSYRTMALFILALLAVVIWMLKTDIFEKIMTAFLNM